MAEEVWKPPSGPLSEDQRVAGVRKLLDGASPAVRRAVISLALHAELDAARRDYTRVYAEEERYKAALIRANGHALRTCAEHFDAGLALLTELRQVAALVVQAAVEVESRERVLALAMAQLAAVCGPWRDAPPGLERGEGLSGYDNADGVEQARQAARRLHEQYLRRRQKATG